MLVCKMCFNPTLYMFIRIIIFNLGQIMACNVSGFICYNLVQFCYNQDICTRLKKWYWCTTLELVVGVWMQVCVSRSVQVCLFLPSVVSMKCVPADCIN